MLQKPAPALDYQQHIHVFRGLAIILIVCAHTIPPLDWSAIPRTGAFIDALANQSSIFFFFIAGYLFQHLSSRFEYRRYLKQKLKTVILPYIILSVPALFIFAVLVPRVGMWPWFYDLPVIEKVALFLVTGKHLAPLWFVPTITLFYLAAPLFLWIDRKCPRAYWSIVPLLLLSAYLGRGGQLGPLNFAQYLLPVYLMGMAFSHDKDKALLLVSRWKWLLLAVALVSIAGYVLGWPRPPFYQVPLKVSLCLLITLWLHRFHHIVGNRLNYLAEVSFGIFFIHAYFIVGIKVMLVYWLFGSVYKGENSTLVAATVPTYLLYVLVVLAVSVATIWIAQKILKTKSRMVVGA